MRAVLLAAAVTAISLSPALALDSCGRFKWSVAREQQLFGAATLPVLSSGGTLASLGSAAAVTLKPEGDVAYSVKPARSPKSSPAYGAEETLGGGVTTAGLIEVTVSADAWVDLAQNGKTLRSAGFSGQTGCPAVRKSVRFAVTPGPVTILISDSPVATLDLAVMTADPAP